MDHYDELWVGISNPLRRLPDNIESYDDDLKQSVLEARQEYKNIFTFLEREEMIRSTLKDEGIDMNRVRIYPHFGYYEEENWADFFPPKEMITIVMHCKDPHHDRKVDYYKTQGWNVEAIPLLKEGYSGTLFHKEYPNGRWRDLVPDGTRRFLEEKISKS